MFILLSGKPNENKKKGFESLSLKKKVKKKFNFVPSMSQFSMMRTSFFFEKVGANLTNRRGLVKECLFLSFVKKKNNDKSFNKKKEAKYVQNVLLL